MDSGTEQEFILLRTKLEVRTWMLRLSMAINTGLITGLIVWYFTK